MFEKSGDKLTVNPFDYVKSINETKFHMMKGTANDELAEKDYNPFITNRALSMFIDTIIYANEMNIHHELDNRLQYDFLFNIVRRKKRYAKWPKKIDSADIELVKEYFDFSTSKAEDALMLLDEDDIIEIKNRLEKGGVK